MGVIKGEYPQPRGRKLESVATLNGPASYAPVVPGNPPTGGQVLTSLQQVFGFNYVDFVTPSQSSNGQYEVNVIYPGNPPQGVATFTLQWLTAATGAEVSAGTNLSGVSVRLLGVGS